MKTYFFVITSSSNSAISQSEPPKTISVTTKPQRHEYSITNIDYLVKNGGGQVELFNKTLKEKVPFNKFGISIEDGEASVSYVDKDSINGAKHKGAAREAYKISIS